VPEAAAEQVREAEEERGRGGRRDRDRGQGRERRREQDKEKERDKVKDKDKEKEKEKEKVKEKEKEKVKDKTKEKEQAKPKRKEKEKEQEKVKVKAKGKNKEKENEKKKMKVKVKAKEREKEKGLEPTDESETRRGQGPRRRGSRIRTVGSERRSSGDDKEEDDGSSEGSGFEGRVGVSGGSAGMHEELPRKTSAHPSPAVSSGPTLSERTSRRLEVEVEAEPSSRRSGRLPDIWHHTAPIFRGPPSLDAISRLCCSKGADHPGIHRYQAKWQDLCERYQEKQTESTRHQMKSVHRSVSGSSVDMPSMRRDYWLSRPSFAGSDNYHCNYNEENDCNNLIRRLTSMFVPCEVCRTDEGEGEGEGEGEEVEHPGLVGPIPRLEVSGWLSLTFEERLMQEMESIGIVDPGVEDVGSEDDVSHDEAVRYQEDLRLLERELDGYQEFLDSHVKEWQDQHEQMTSDAEMLRLLMKEMKRRPR
jgi:outer membrane biosynthesis protein TonB